MQDIIHEPIQLASIGRRIAAFFIDHILFTFCIVMGIFLMVGTEFEDIRGALIRIVGMLAILIPGLFIYTAKDTVKGISPGKWVMGIMVRDANDPTKVPNFGRLLVRNLLIFIWPVEMIILATNPERRRLGDQIGKTVVLNNPKKANKVARVIPVVLVAGILLSGMFLLVASTIKNSGAYEEAIVQIESDAEIIENTGGITGYGYLPMGSIQMTNGSGTADLTIIVKGNTSNARVHIHLTKSSWGEWEKQEMSTLYEEK
jgi:uncharacterized RDD family membrane protein YckC